jgi:hypothetical protein
MHGDIGGRFHAHANLVATDTEYGKTYMVTDGNHFADAPGKY